MELLERLVAAATLASYRLAASAERRHGETSLTAAQRAVLLAIDERGPQTASALAGARSVSRQFIHSLTREMIAEGWLEARPNPARRRSLLLSLTSKAGQAVEAIRTIEAPDLERLAARFEPTDLAAAVATLDALNAALAARAVRAPGRRRR